MLANTSMVDVENERVRHSGTRQAGAIALAILLLSVLWSAQSAWAHHIAIPRGDGQQFLWPLGAWLNCTDFCENGNHHSGTVDISAPYYTPIYAARHGTVEAFGFYARQGWWVRVGHDTVGNREYKTSYIHLVRQPSVTVGQVVAAGELLGYLGRTGNAATPHLHFQIYRYENGSRAPMRLPPEDAPIGAWVKAGQHIPGVYDPDLAPIAAVSPTYDVRVIEPDGLWSYTSTYRNVTHRLVKLSQGAEGTVLDTHRGQYKIAMPGGAVGWVPSSGVVPLDNEVFGVDVTGGMNIRRTPTGSGDLIGYANAGWLLAGFEEGPNGWSKVRWMCSWANNRSTDSADNTRELGGCPALVQGGHTSWKYGWIGALNTVRTSSLKAKTMVQNVRVHPNRIVNGESQPNFSVVIDHLPSHHIISGTTGTWNGWYRFERNGQTSWIRGWYTTTRL